MEVLKDGYLYDTATRRFIHRIISTRYDGIIPKGWHVHHCDYNRTNNSIDNLVQIPEKLHQEIHATYDWSSKHKPSKEFIRNTMLPSYLGRINFKGNRTQVKRSDIAKRKRIYLKGIGVIRKKKRKIRKPRIPREKTIISYGPPTMEELLGSIKAIMSGKKSKQQVLSSRRRPR
jgi:hypothetical protein